MFLSMRREMKTEKSSLSFPKLMVSDEKTSIDKPYLAIVLFEKPRCGMCLWAHQSSSCLTTGTYYEDLDINSFEDYEDKLELKNIVE